LFRKSRKKKRRGRTKRPFSVRGKSQKKGETLEDKGR